MANVATTLTAIPMAMSTGLQGFSKITPVVCTFDTTGADLTIFTPELSTNYAAIVGLVYEEASAHSLTVKSGSTTYVTLERTTFDGAALSVGTSGFIIIGGRGEALKLNCGTAPISSLLAYCCEFPSLNFNNR
jgi:hypothetical protein